MYVYSFVYHINRYKSVFDPDYTLAKTLGVTYVFEWIWAVFFCVLTVVISPTKSMSTKNPKLVKTLFSHGHVED